MKAATKAKKRPETANRGAADARAHIKAHLKVRIKFHKKTGNDGLAAILQQEVDFIDSMAKRAIEKPGGLGRKKLK